MIEFLSDPRAQVVILLAATAIVVAVGFFVVRKFRDVKEEDQVTASDLITNFRELHSRGTLSDQEFRNIKTLLADRLQSELKDSDEKGY